MSTLTIRNVPDDLHARLKERARRNRRSLNQEVIAELDAALSGSETGEGRLARRRAINAQATREVARVREEVTGYMTAEEILEAIEDGRA